MSRSNICHYRCFAADKRMSMDIYADSLAKALDDNDYQLTSVIPQSTLEKFGHSKTVMRCLRYWRYPRLVEQYQADIHHVLDHGYAHLHPRLQGGKTVVSVHDLIPMLRWNGQVDFGDDITSKSRKPVLNLKSLSFLERYDHIIAISDSTKRDLETQLNIAPEKITVIPPIIGDHFRPVAKPDLQRFQKKYDLDADCQWLMISGNEFYKNHRTSLAVLKRLLSDTDLNLKLIKTGHLSDEFSALVTELGLQDRVRSLFLEDVGELPLMYGFVDCVLFPSFYEGFGMPVAEALACGTPVVSSNRGSLPEVGGNLALQCDPLDLEAIVAAVERALVDPSLARLTREHGLEWLTQFRSATVGEKLAGFYNDLARG